MRMAHQQAGPGRGSRSGGYNLFEQRWQEDEWRRCGPRRYLIDDMFW